MTEAADSLGVTNHTVRRLIRTGVLTAEQVIPGAPYQIRASDLAAASVQGAALSRNPYRRLTLQPRNEAE